MSANVGYSEPGEGVTTLKLVGRADEACREAKSRNEVQPLKWTPDVQREAPKSERKKCACGGTTTLLVAPSRRKPTAMAACSNCGQPFARAS